MNSLILPFETPYRQRGAIPGMNFLNGLHADPKNGST
jgi:hypothetical protein